MKNIFNIARGITYLLSIFLLSCNSESEDINEIGIEVNKNKDTVSFLTSYTPKTDTFIQTFQINLNEKREIKGKQGTLIKIPAGCFGKETRNIKLELIECYSIQSMLLNNLSTQTTEGKLLETDGMIYLNALNEAGDTLEIKKGKIQITMSTQNRKKNIRIFEGEQKNGHIAWRLSDENLLLESNKDFSVETKFIEDEVTDIPIGEYGSAPTVAHKDSIYKKQPSVGKPRVIVDKKIKNENLVNYVFQFSQMGWINCDRYIEGKTKNLLVNVDEKEQKVKIYLLLKNINSILPPLSPEAIKGQFEFPNVPISEPFILIALATKGEETYFGIANHDTHERAINCPELKRVTRQELTDLLFEKFGTDIWNRPPA